MDKREDLVPPARLEFLDHLDLLDNEEIRDSVVIRAHREPLGLLDRQVSQEILVSLDQLGLQDHLVHSVQQAHRANRGPQDSLEIQVQLVHLGVLVLLEVLVQLGLLELPVLLDNRDQQDLKAPLVTLDCRGPQDNRAARVQQDRLVSLDLQAPEEMLDQVVMQVSQDLLDQ